MREEDPRCILGPAGLRSSQMSTQLASRSDRGVCIYVAGLEDRRSDLRVRYLPSRLALCMLARSSFGYLDSPSARIRFGSKSPLSKRTLHIQLIDVVRSSTLASYRSDHTHTLTN